MSGSRAAGGSNADSYSGDSESSESYTINFAIRVRSLKRIFRQEIARSREEKKSRRKEKKKSKKDKKKKSKKKSKDSADENSRSKRRGKSTRTRSVRTRSVSKTRSPTRLGWAIFHDVAVVDFYVQLFASVPWNGLSSDCLCK